MCAASNTSDTRVSSDFIQAKTEGVHFFPQEFALTVFIGLKLLVATGTSVLLFNVEDREWNPMEDGGAHWWIPFHPVLVLPKNMVGCFFAYAERTRAGGSRASPAGSRAARR